MAEISDAVYDRVTDFRQKLYEELEKDDPDSAIVQRLTDRISDLSDTHNLIEAVGDEDDEGDDFSIDDAGARDGGQV